MFNQENRRRALFEDEGGRCLVWGCDIESGPLQEQTKNLFEIKNLRWGGRESQQALVIGE